MKVKAELIVGIASLMLNDEERKVLLHPKIHGIILFTRNYQSPQQLFTLTQEIHALRVQNPLKIYVDQEGGRVQRFRKGFTLLPPLAEIQPNEVFAWAELMATELKILGIDFSFAPVVDLNRQSQVIGDRAFSDDPAVVIARSEIYLNGMAKAGMLGILKHFPGHGSVLPDTHQHVAIDERSFTIIEQSDLQPFIHFAKREVGMMISHVVYPAVDSQPASLSKFWITDYLRGQLGFSGPIFTDDLGMKAISELATASKLVKQAFQAGADYALLCNNWPAVLDTLHAIA